MTFLSTIDGHLRFWKDCFSRLFNGSLLNPSTIVRKTFQWVLSSGGCISGQADRVFVVLSNSILVIVKNVKRKTLTWHYGTSNLQRCPWVPFPQAIDCLACSLPLKVVCFPSETPVEKTQFSFASGYWLEIASELGMGLCLFFLSLPSLSVSCTFS